MTRTILRIDASARRTGSVTRQLTDDILARFGPAEVTTRDLLTTPVPQISEAWVAANFTPADQRSADQVATLALSDTLVGELQAADTIVIGLPIYNFGVPAALKAWIDQVARAGVTFQYSAEGPVGLLTGKRAVVAVASGGTEAGSEIDFATGYVRHVLAFLGITDVTFVAADRLMVDADASMSAANAQVAALDVAA
ncbi:MAG: NAD(P)H-dependent oxidoreductase [Pseudomonadota bacterium]